MILAITRIYMSRRSYSYSIMNETKILYYTFIYRLPGSDDTTILLFIVTMHILANTHGAHNAYWMHGEACKMISILYMQNL